MAKILSLEIFTLIVKNGNILNVDKTAGKYEK